MYHMSNNYYKEPHEPKD